MKHLLAFLIFSVSFGALLGIPSFTAAQSSTGVSVSPVSFDFGINPGQTETNVIRVTNTSNAELQLETRVENIIGTDDRGQVTLSEQETEFSITKWVTTSPSRFTLKAKETTTISFTIKVPVNAEPGGHYGSILIGTVASNDPSTGSGSAIAQRVGSLLLVRVAGTSTERGVVTDFYPKNFVGRWDEVKSDDNSATYYIPREEKYDQERKKAYFSTGPVAFSITYKNEGNVHFRPTGFVTIHNFFGKKVAELPLEPRNVFPGVERQLTVLWPKKQLWGGYYKAQLVAVYGQNNASLGSTTNFWAFPSTTGLAIIALLVLVLVARKRLTKAIRILIKGQ